MAEINDAGFRLSERTALISGPSNSMVQSISQRLTQLGCNVVLIDRQSERADRLVKQLLDTREVNERFGRAIAIPTDITKSHHVQEAVGKAAEAFGGIDFVIDTMLAHKPIALRDPSALEDLDRLIDVNLRAPLVLVHEVLKYLESRRRGRILFIVHDIIRKGLGGVTLHAATRMGFTEVAKTLSIECASAGITVNCIAAGVTEEFLMQNALPPPGAVAGKPTGVPPMGGQSIHELHQELLRDHPRAQLTDPDQIASAVAFLVSPLASGITGQTISVSRGL